MANFHTHLSIALTLSTGIAGIGIGLGLWGIFDGMLLVGAGTLGGLLPDIDLDNAKITRIGFNIASLIVATYLAIAYAAHRSAGIGNVLMLWGVGVVVLRFGILATFSRLTRHRGMVHSVPYVAMLSLLVIYGAYYGLELVANLAWELGVFLFFGAIIHLLLDELYSVNIYGLRVKKSFGTAFKFFSPKQPLAYLVLYGMTVALWFFAPQKGEFLAMLRLFIAHCQRLGWWT